MITYIFTSKTFSGQTIDVQYSKYSSNTRLDLGSGTFPFSYTTDQKGGTYYFYIPSIDRTYPKTIDIPPIDIYTNEINVPECDLSGVTIFVPPCDVTGTTIFVPVCDIEYDVEPQIVEDVVFPKSKLKAVFYKNRELLNQYIREDGQKSVFFSSLIISMICYEKDFIIPINRDIDKIIEFEINGLEVDSIPTGYLLVMIKNSSDYEDATKYFSDNKLTVERYFTPFRTFFIKIPSDVLNSSNIYEINNNILKENFCKYSELDTISKAELNYQIPYESSYHWYLQDIKSREAWELMDGQPEETTYGGHVEVAMIDTQVDIYHPELVGKISTHSFNPFSLYWSEIEENEVGLDLGGLSLCAQQGGIDVYRFFHGTGSAGLIAASNSNNDLMYSASNDKVKIQVISFSAFKIINGDCQDEPFDALISFYTGGGIIASLNKIYENPNCVSIVTAMIWGFYSVELIQEVITIVTNEGRNGKGIPFFVSSGNSGIPTVDHPGVYRDAYPVGASNQLRNKAGFSQYGNKLFICAPGEKIMSLSPRGRLGKDLGLVYTIPKPPRVPKNLKDIIFTNQSLQVSDGTSSSAPIVAAIAATMVYVNPSLTKTQIVNILAETATKSTGTEGYIYTNGKNIELGYGIVNHEEAIKESILRIPAPIEPEDDQPILVKILRLPEMISHGGTAEIVFEITLLDSIVLGTEYLKTEIYVGDNNSGYLLISEFTYNEFSQITSFIENIEIPIEPFGFTRNKYIKIIAKSFNGISLIPTGEQNDFSIVQITSPIDINNLVNMELTFLGIECLNNGIPCNQADGLAWKVRVLNTGNAGVIWQSASAASWILSIDPVGIDNALGAFGGFYTNISSSGFDLSYSTEVINPGEERILYIKFLFNFDYANSNLPLTLGILNIIQFIPLQEYDPLTGISYDSIEYQIQFASNTLEITEWPG